MFENRYRTDTERLRQREQNRYRTNKSEWSRYRTVTNHKYGKSILPNWPSSYNTIFFLLACRKLALLNKFQEHLPMDH